MTAADLFAVIEESGPGLDGTSTQIFDDKRDAIQGHARRISKLITDEVRDRA